MSGNNLKCIGEETSGARERPILFSGSMVRAILAGQKTQTRRVVRPQPDEVFFDPAVCRYSERGHSGAGLYVSCADYPEEGSQHTPCPYGAPGDTLWVRETWQKFRNDAGYEVCVWRATANDDCVDIAYPDGVIESVRIEKWRPSIFMRRMYSRIILRVTDVRAERVQDISEEDAVAEGCRAFPGAADGNGIVAATARWDYRRLWDSINGKRGFGWEVNPWVWVVSFEVNP